MKEYAIRIPITIVTQAGNQNHTVTAMVPAPHDDAAHDIAIRLAAAVSKATKSGADDVLAVAGSILVKELTPTTTTTPRTADMTDVFDTFGDPRAGTQPLADADAEAAAIATAQLLATAGDQLTLLDVCTSLDANGVHDPDRAIADRALHLIREVLPYTGNTE
jgi:hypothetical protein